MLGVRSCEVVDGGMNIEYSSTVKLLVNVNVSSININHVLLIHVLY